MFEKMSNSVVTRVQWEAEGPQAQYLVVRIEHGPLGRYDMSVRGSVTRLPSGVWSAVVIGLDEKHGPQQFRVLGDQFNTCEAAKEAVELEYVSYCLGS